MSKTSLPSQKKSIPPKLIVRLGKFVWTTLWQMMMAKLAPRDPLGAYIRPESEFRQTVSGDATSPYPAATGRYKLIVGLGCPWAHRTLIVRALKGLDAAIALVAVSPSADGMWVFDQAEEGCHSLPELYQLAKPGYGGRCTVPVLWDSQSKTIVNNESAEIIVILNAEFNEFAQQPQLDLYPPDLRPLIDQWNSDIYQSVNNGVYRCGFAQTQLAYEQACNELFAMLDKINTVLATQRFLCGDRVTLADIRLFTTLFRFDIVYYGLFKCNRFRIQDYQHLGAYLRDLYQLPGVADTCNLDAIKRDYYGNLFPLNPGGIIPLGPDVVNLLAAHGREALG
jgi:glutathionyl-hydroquinone reductase